MTEHQLMFNLKDGPEHRAESPRHAMRREAKETPVDDALHSTRDRIRKLPVVQFIRIEEIWLRGFVKCLAHSEAARSREHQEQAIALLNVFDTLSDFDLALELRKLGLCDSTTTFGCKLTKGQCVLLQKFRRVMHNYEKWPDPAN